MLLETLHEYARERLEASGEAEALRRAHATYYLALAEAAEPQLRGPEQGAWLERLEREHDNLRTALAWAQDAGDTAYGLRLAGALWRFWYTRGPVREGCRWLEGMLAQAGTAGGCRPSTAAQAKALRGAAGLAVAQRRHAEATAWAEESVTLCRVLGDRAGQASALHILELAVRANGDMRRARMLFEASAELAREVGDAEGVATSLNNLGLMAYDEGDLQHARALFEESLALRQALGRPEGIAASLHSLGIIARAQGAYTQATNLHEEALGLCRVLDDKRGTALILTGLGHIAREQGDMARAMRHYSESLTMLQELQDPGMVGECLEGLAAAAYTHRQWTWAARLCGAAAALGVTMAWSPSSVDRATHDRAVAATRAALGDDAFAVAWTAGQALSPELAVVVALEGSRAISADVTRDQPDASSIQAQPALGS